MSHKFFFSIALIAFLLTACASPAPTPTPTPVPPTATAIPTATATAIPPTALPSTATSIPSPASTATPTRTQTPQPTVTPTSTGLTRRLITGTYVVDNRVTSMGQLDIENTQDLDAVVVLATYKQTLVVLAASYVRAHESFSIERISDGGYNLYVTLGEDWDAEAAKFTRNSIFFWYNVGIPFSTNRTTTTIYYTHQRAQLDPKLQVAQTLSSLQFPSLK